MQLLRYLLDQELKALESHSTLRLLAFLEPGCSEGHKEAATLCYSASDSTPTRHKQPHGRKGKVQKPQRTRKEIRSSNVASLRDSNGRTTLRPGRSAMASVMPKPVSSKMSSWPRSRDFGTFRGFLGAQRGGFVFWGCRLSVFEL